MVQRFDSRSAGATGRPSSYVILLLLVALVVLGGGSSRADVLSLLYLRPLAIAAMAYFLCQPLDWPSIRPLGWLLAGMAALDILHLVPLPPSLLRFVPGREAFGAIEALNGTGSRWRGLSLDPEATLNALFSLTVPAAVLLGVGATGREGQRALLPAVIGTLVSSGILGVLQVAGGGDSPFYLYGRTYPGFAVGWFANRNHQAAALACLFPLLFAWAGHSDGKLKPPVRHGLSIALAALVLPMIAITGSRAGLILGLVSLGLSLGLMMPGQIAVTRRTALLAAGAVGIAVAMGGLLLFFGRAVSLDRLFQSDLGSEGRLAYLPTEWRMLGQSWPVGVGPGAFDAAMRRVEPDQLLHTTYFNHAHNDFLETALVAGLPGLLLLGAALLTLLFWTARVCWPLRGGGDTRRRGRSAAIVLWIVACASIVDYPVRAPLTATLVVIAAAWLRAGVVAPQGRVRLR